MKLFGGSGGHSGKPSRAKKKKTAQYAAPIADEKPQAAKTAPKPTGKKGGRTKKPLTKGQKRKRVIVTVAVVLALLASVAAAAAILVRPPKGNDPTIKDKENGDKIDVNSLLNSGTRIDDVVTFVVGAVDEDETRTDALMVVTMDTNKKTINVMNIPRDTMCNNSATGASRKINAAYAIGGIEQTKKEIERLLGFRPDYYVIVNFDGIAAIVDAIGGVEYEVPFRMEYDDPSQDLHIDLYAGNQTLNGDQVVQFLRWRHNNDYSVQYPNGDEGRVENQQKFLKELANQVFQLKNITQIPIIADGVFQNDKTDLTAGNLLWMGMQALKIKNDSIQFFTLPGYGQMSTAGSSTAYSFFFPYYQETLDLVNQYFNPYEEDITALDMVSGPESYSGGGYDDTDPYENYVWGDTASSDEPSDDASGGDVSADPEVGGTEGDNSDAGGGTTTGPDTGGTTTDPNAGGTGGSTTDPNGGTTTDPNTGGSGGGSGGTTTDPNGGTGDGTTTSPSGGASGGGTTDPGGSSGGGESSGGETTPLPGDPEA